MGISAAACSRLSRPLLGRVEECAELRGAFEDAASGRATVVTLSGDAGAGKTALCRYLVGHAESHGARVLATSCVEGEADLALAGISALLRPVAEFASALPPVQRQTVAAACGLADGAAGADRFVLGAATLGLLAAAAEQQPLVVLVDDVHWLDEPSRDALQFAVRRLGADAVLVVIAARGGRGLPGLDALARPLPVGGLGRDDLAATLDQAGMGVGDDVAGAIHAATDGLPLPALETAAALSAAQRAGTDLLPDPLPVGRAVLERFRARLDQLPDPTRRALATVAAAGSAPASVLHQALAELSLDADDLSPAEDTGIVTMSDGCVVIAHPLLRAAAYAHCAASVRRAIHAALAHASNQDPERRARHLAASSVGPSEDLAAAVEAAAHRVRDRAGPAAAAHLLRRAAEATPSGPRRDQRLLAALVALAAGGRHDDAQHIARHLAATADDPNIRADATLVQLGMSVWGADSDQMLRVATGQAQQIAATDPARAARALFMASTAATGHGALNDALSLAQRAHELAASTDDPALLEAAREQHAMDLVLLGRHREALVLLQEPRQVRADPTEVHALQQPATLQTLTRLARLDEADVLAGELLAVCARDQAPTTKAYVLAVTEELRWWQGRWVEALACGEEAVTLAAQTGQEVLGWFSGAVRGRILAGLGRDHDARETVGRALSASGAESFLPLRLYGPAALGFLELGRGNHAAAVAHLLAAEAARRETGLCDPRTVPFGPDLVEALARSGDCPAARRALAELDERMTTAATCWGLAVTTRCHALLEDDPSRADTLYEQALEHHRKDGSPFDLARTQLCRGERRRRHGDHRGARPILQDALATFQALGAAPWADRSAAELRAAGGSPAPLPPETATLDALSPQELQCALAVAQGMTNRETAAALFISHKTVEYHLSKAYTKLGLRSRTQLVRFLDTQSPGATNDRHRCSSRRPRRRDLGS
ncbi:AAA family ATPase [Actinomycetospora chiangmaiensis]|uniref:AAA family ATPase n=1 Tax=Actinomycetospora chiangmaiensis TaxID=402650 RepID=UPI00036290D1|nr:LuxR family transcriptional regulator [Actinomycetospora chiangmaiensis]